MLIFLYRRDKHFAYKKQRRLKVSIYFWSDDFNTMSNPKTIADFLAGKSSVTQSLFHHFVNEYNKLGVVTLCPAKTMIGIDNGRKRIGWITQLGKNFVHVVFPFKQPYNDNLCFQKIAQVPGTPRQYNHHFRMYNAEDINEEVIRFMKLAMEEEVAG